MYERNLIVKKYVRSHVDKKVGLTCGISKTKIQKDSVETVLICINYDNYVNLVARVIVLLTELYFISGDRALD